MTAVPAKTILPSIPLIEKENKLRALMRDMRRVLVAYSGGVDSTYLAFVANMELADNTLCILGISPSVAEHQREEAARTANEFGFKFRVIETDEIDDPNYIANAGNRCYFCKSELYGRLHELATVEQYSYVIDGTNADDVSDHRPGRAAAEEKNVRSPFVELGISKAEIRELSRTHGLPTWDKPASPCLSSRIAYGIPVTIERLSEIEQGEAFLRSLGFREFRLRIHGDIARVAISPDELDSILNRETFEAVYANIKKLGFRHVTLDMEGFRSGELNDGIEK